MIDTHPGGRGDNLISCSGSLTDVFSKATHVAMTAPAKHKKPSEEQLLDRSERLGRLICERRGQRHLN